MKKRIKLLLLLAATSILIFGLPLTAKAANNKVSKVTLVSIETKSASSVKLTWKPVANASGYLILRKTAKGKFKPVKKIKSKKITTFTDKKLKKATVYTYTVQAYRGKQKGSYDKKGLSACTAVTITPQSKPYKNQYVKNKKVYNSRTQTYWTLYSYMELFSGVDSSLLVMKKGTYNIPGTVWIPSGTKLLLRDGVTINKTYDSKGVYLDNEYRLFVFTSPYATQIRNYANGYHNVKNAAVVGQGNAAVNLYTSDSIAFSALHCKNIRIQGVRVNLLATNGKGFLVNGCKNVTISGCGVKGVAPESRGVYIDLCCSKGYSDFYWTKRDNTVCSGVTISGCIFKGLTYAVFSDRFMKNKYHKNIVISSCTFKSISNDAVYMVNWKKPVITGCIFHTISKGAVCTAEPYVAIRFYGVQKPKITGNTFQNVPRAFALYYMKNYDETITKQGNTVNSVSKSQLLMMENQNTFKKLGDYYYPIVTEGKPYEVRWLPDSKRAYVMTATDKPYQNQYVLSDLYLNSFKSNSKYTKVERLAIRQYFVLRSYLEQIERNGGGTLTIKSGNYYLYQRIYIPSNTTIRLESNVTITDANPDSGLMFCMLNKADKNNNVLYYGNNGVHDVQIIGAADGTSVLDKNGYSGNVFTIAHTKNVSIKNIAFRNMNGRSHFIELDASDNFKITGCSFVGCSSNSDKKGAINIDVPDKNTHGFNSSYTSYDCTPNSNVMIAKNMFEDVPLAVETHMHTPGVFHTGITVTNNQITSYYYGIRARAWADIVISNNEITVLSDVPENPVSKRSVCAICLEGVRNATVKGNKATVISSNETCFMRVLSAYYSAKAIAKNPDIKDYGSEVCIFTEDNLLSFADNEVLDATNSKIQYYKEFWDMKATDIHDWNGINFETGEPVTDDNPDDENGADDTNPELPDPESDSQTDELLENCSIL